MSDYWENRAAWDMYEQMKDAEATADVVARVYRSASSQIVFAAQDIFEKYMTKHKLSQTEAWNLLNRMQDKDSIQNLLMELKNKDSGENKQELIRELEAPAYRARIERLQLLLQQVDTVMQNVYQQEQQFDTSFFEQLAENAYYRTIYNTQCRTGLGFSFSHVDQKQIDRALRMNWSGKHYSNRIWKNTDDLAKTVKDELLVSLLTDRTDRETAAVITEKFGGGAITVSYTHLKMPPLQHKSVDGKYDVMKSEVIDWMVKQPDVRQWLYDKVVDKTGGKNPEFICYNADKKMWQGVDYDGD